MQNALKTLDWTTIPATYEESVNWITRLFAHYPRLDAVKAGIMVADLAEAIVNESVSLLAVSAVCDDSWREATTKNPWPPTTGELLKEMVEKTALWKRMTYRLQDSTPALEPPKPVVSENPYGGRLWPEFNEDDLERFWGQMRQFSPTIQTIYRKTLKVPDDVADPLVTEKIEIESDNASVNANNDKALKND